MIRVNTGRGYTWKCDFGLCHWTQPTIRQLRGVRLRSDKCFAIKPSPEATAVSVRLVEEQDFRLLMQVARAGHILNHYQDYDYTRQSRAIVSRDKALDKLEKKGKRIKR